MQLTGTRASVLIVGVVMVVAMCGYPPWVGARPLTEGRLRQMPAGYALLTTGPRPCELAPNPEGTEWWRTRVPVYDGHCVRDGYDPRIDFSRLGLQLGALILVVLALLVTLPPKPTVAAS